MDRSTVIAKLREHEPELKAAGIVRLSLFGPVARGDASSDSDVDLMAEFDSARQFSILDMVGLENRLAYGVAEFQEALGFHAAIQKHIEDLIANGH